MSHLEDYRVQRERIYTHPDGGPRSSAMPATPIISSEAAVKIKDCVKMKDMALIQLREELVIQKHIERRYQKQVDALEANNSEAPRMIKALREEVMGVKNRLRDLQTHRHNDERRLRAQGEEIAQLQRTNQELQDLVEAKDLKQRSELADALALKQRKLNEMDHQLAEAARRQELVEKNMTSENRHLRGKLLNMEHEGQCLKDRVQQMEELIREKDREIASLSIYRYGAVHRKAEPCKVCAQRNLEQKEAERHCGIMDRLPRLAKPSLSVISATSVRVTIDLPLISETVQYDHAQLFFDRQLADDTAPPRSIIIQPPTTDDQCKWSMNLGNLQTGQFYHCKLIAYMAEFESDTSDVETVLIDVLPLAPCKPSVNIKVRPLEMSVTIQPPQSNGGSSISQYRIYHASMPVMRHPQDTVSTTKEFFLLAELIHSPSTTEQKERPLVYKFLTPQVGTQHIFKVTAVNSMGESAFSEECGPCLLDLTPGQPKAPSVKKQSVDSVQVTISPPKANGGSDINFYEIHYAEVAEDHPNLEHIVVNVPYPRQLVHIIDHLSPGSQYVFAVVAHNRVGPSEMSQYCDTICLDHMLPIPSPPQCLILSPSSVKFLFYFDHKKVRCPSLTGYRLYLSSSYIINPGAANIASPFIPFCEGAVAEHTIEALEFGGSYYCVVSLLSAHSESAISAPLWISLAAAIPLPETPSRGSTPTLRSSLPMLQESAPLPPPTTLSRSKSRSIDLSLSQRIQNMYRGNPAFALPAEIRAQAEADGVSVHVNQGGLGSMENLQGKDKGHQRTSSSGSMVVAPAQTLSTSNKQLGSMHLDRRRPSSIVPPLPKPTGLRNVTGGGGGHRRSKGNLIQH